MILKNLSAATMARDQPYGLVSHAVIVCEGEKIAWVGSENDMPAVFSDHDAIDLDGRLVTPALIDCHTHLVSGGNRAREFEMRLQGASYEEISRAGGGIVSTVKATRAASEDELVANALPRVDALISEGATTVAVSYTHLTLPTKA